MFDPYPSLEHSFEPLPNEKILQVLNSQKPERLSSAKFMTCKYMVEDMPYVFKFLHESHAYNHYYNSEIYRFLSLPIHTNRIFSFEEEQLSGFKKLNFTKLDKTISFLKGNSNKFQPMGVYMPYIPGKPLPGIKTRPYQNVLDVEHFASLCVAQANDICYDNIIQRCDDSLFNNKQYVIDPEIGIMSFRKEDSSEPLKNILIPEIGNVSFKQTKNDIERTLTAFNFFSHNVSKPGFYNIVSENIFDIIKKLNSTPSAVLEEFDGMKERMIGCALCVNNTMHRIRDLKN